MSSHLRKKYLQNTFLVMEFDSELLYKVLQLNNKKTANQFF